MKMQEKITNLIVTGKLLLTKGAEVERQGELVVLTVSETLKPKKHANRTLLMKLSGSANTYTLPNASGSGNTYHFKVATVNTSNYLIKVANATDTIDGQLVGSDTDTSGACRGWDTASTSDTITLNGTTTGGVTIGDWIELQDIAAGQYAVRGQITGSGVVATPFSATVS